MDAFSYTAMNRFFIASGLVFLTTACSHSPQRPIANAAMSGTVSESITRFSASASKGVPLYWEPLVIHRTKKLTEYKLVPDDGRTVLHATAKASSSGLMQKVRIDPYPKPWLSWRWKIGSLIATANNSDGHAEDSPARIILGFDGDKDTLPFSDQILFETARVMTGHDFPYATLMYIWENKAPVGTVINSSRSGRIKMMVAASGPDGVGQWKNFARNIAEDYEKAFGEKPGKLIGVGVLSDTDNTGESVEAWYGDIRLERERH